MKKLGILILALGLLGGATYAAPPNLADISTQMKTLGGTIGDALPLSAATGLNWSDAYIGSIIGVPPHFGVGVSVGASFMPSKSIDNLVNALGVTIPDATKAALSLGIPLPTYTVEARVGGAFLPFDVGLKVGILSTDPKTSTGPAAYDYTMIGGEFRYALMEDSLVTPAISLGLGYTYLKGGVFLGMPTINLATVPTGVGTSDTLDLADPKLGLVWESGTVDLKAQISKNLLVVTPYAGVGLSITNLKAGGGFYATPKFAGTPINAAQIAYLKANFPGAVTGDAIDISENGIVAMFKKDGVITARLFAGASLNIIIVKLDLAAMYNINAGTFGGNLGFRVQL